MVMMFLSRVSDSDNRRLKIEVKTSTRSALSLLGIQPQLPALTVEEVGTHIRANAGRGIWESVRIPFEAFKSAFVVPQLHH